MLSNRIILGAVTAVIAVVVVAAVDAFRSRDHHTAARPATTATTTSKVPVALALAPGNHSDRESPLEGLE